MLDAIRSAIQVSFNWIFELPTVWLLALGGVAVAVVAALTYYAQSRDLGRRAADRIASLPLLWTVPAIVLVAGALGLAGYYMYETYDYVQHDNDFCLSCHVMEEPYERFARSEHRDLGCKACHQPTLMARSRMAMEQILEQPDTLTAHAEVPNQRCADCHIEGNPERWRIVSATAGHQVHFESDDPALEGLKCVECHSSSVHEFTPTNQTCGQADCHQDVDVKLGDMADLTIHCVACHDFATPVEEGPPDEPVREAAAEALRPQQQQCLSCHAMRQMLPDFPEDGPHDAKCASCHNPHEQVRPAEAVQTCTNSGCHSQVDTIPNFHHQRPTIRLSECLQCHRAHGFSVQEENCLSCHQDIFQRDRPPARTTAGPRNDPAPSARSGPSPADRAPEWHGAPRDRDRPGAGGGPSAPGRDAPFPGGPAPEAAEATSPGAEGPSSRADRWREPGTRQDTVRFYHADHRDVECQSCHRLGQPAALAAEAGWCRECHHSAERTEPVEAACLGCHDPGEFGAGDFRLARSLQFSVRDAEIERDLPFRHSTHEELECTKCHQGRPDLSAEGVSCAECHQDHHRIDARCAECHVPASEADHPLEVHVTCSGSGCHASIPFESVPRTRAACLGCHQDLADHRPERDCVACHVLPDPARISGAVDTDATETESGTLEREGSG